MATTTIGTPKNIHASFNTTLEYFDSELAPMDQAANFYRLELLNDRDYLLNQFNQEADEYGEHNEYGDCYDTYNDRDYF